MKHTEISARCKQAGISMNELGNRLGSSRQRLFMIEQGLRPAKEDFMRLVEIELNKADKIKAYTDGVLSAPTA